MADFYPSVRWIVVEKRVPAAYREVLAWLACVAVLVREVGGCFIEWSACGEAVGSSWRAAAEGGGARRALSKASERTP